MNEYMAKYQKYLSYMVQKNIYTEAHWICCFTFNLLPLIIWSEACVGLSVQPDQAYGSSICGQIYVQDFPSWLIQQQLYSD